MSKRLKAFLKDESGSEFLEWVTVALILVMATVPTLILIGQELERILAGILEELVAVPEP
jgi:Flp pilus assembly pilin Flp